MPRMRRRDRPPPMVRRLETAQPRQTPQGHRRQPGQSPGQGQSEKRLGTSRSQNPSRVVRPHGDPSRTKAHDQAPPVAATHLHRAVPATGRPRSPPGAGRLPPRNRRQGTHDKKLAENPPHTPRSRPAPGQRAQRPHRGHPGVPGMPNHRHRHRQSRGPPPGTPPSRRRANPPARRTTPVLPATQGRHAHAHRPPHRPDGKPRHHRRCPLPRLIRRRLERRRGTGPAASGRPQPKGPRHPHSPSGPTRSRQSAHRGQRRPLQLRPRTEGVLGPLVVPGLCQHPQGAPDQLRPPGPPAAPQGLQGHPTGPDVWPEHPDHLPLAGPDSRPAPDTEAMGTHGKPPPGASSAADPSPGPGQPPPPHRW